MKSILGNKSSDDVYLIFPANTLNPEVKPLWIIIPEIGHDWREESITVGPLPIL